MNRRRLLEAGLAGGAAVVGTVLLGSTLDPGEGDADPSGTTPEPSETTPEPGTPTETTEEPEIRHANEYGTVVDVVRAGADPTGEVPVNDLLETHAGDDTLLSFGPGKYRLRPIELSDYSHLGVAAAGPERPTFVSAADRCIPGPYLWFRSVDDLLLDRLAFEFPGDGSGGEVRVTADGDATVRDVRAVGSCPDQIALFRIDVTDEQGTGLVEDFWARNGNDDPTLTCIYVGEDHAGEVTFRDCDLRGFSDNGLYASSPGHPDGGNGTVHVEGGIYQNNNVSNVRLGSTGSTATGVRVVADAVPVADSVNVRGIRLRERGDQVIQDCDIYIGRAAGDGFGGIVFHSANTGAAVRSTTVTIDRDTVPAVRAFPNEKSASGPVFEDLTVRGDAARGFAAVLDGRRGTVFRNCDIEQTGTGRGGLRLAFSHDCRIEGCRIDVDGDPIVLRQSTATVRDTTLVTPDGERYVDEMEAEDEDFTPR